LAISRKKKEELVQGYVKLLNNSEAIIITGNNSMKVSELDALREKIREAEGKFSIVKNTLAKRAIEEAHLPGVDELLTGPVGIGFCCNNAGGVAKAITDFAKKNEHLVIKGGLLGNSVLDEAAVKNLANLPSLNELRGQIVGLIGAPASSLVGALAGGVRQIVNVIHAYADKEDEAEAKTEATTEVTEATTTEVTEATTTEVTEATDEVTEATDEVTEATDEVAEATS
jgi:large subunit ribosomal protein L10